MEGESTGVRRRGQPSSENAGETLSSETAEGSQEASNKPKRDFSAALEKAVTLMSKEKFAEATPILETALEGLDKKDKDAACLHNLGVCYGELGAFQQAENVFWEALELVPQSSDEVFSTMYGLAASLTSQDDTCKLMTAEHLLRDILVKGEQRSGKGAMEDMYRSYVLLGENFQQQKKWSDALDCWNAAVIMGEGMFGKDHEMVEKHRRHLAKATRLAKWQGRLRIVSWTFCIALPTGMAYYMYRNWPPAMFANWNQGDAGYGDRPGMHPGL